MVVYTAIRDGDTIEDALYDIDPLVDTSNPFGDFCVLKIDDRGGEKFEQYPRGTRIDVLVSGDSDALTINSGDTFTTESGVTETYSAIYNSGTYSNAGTVQSDGSDINRFTGYVVERREIEQGGADALEVEAYSFDQFLRRNTVTNDQTGNTITEALEDIVETDTPVTYVAGNVDVGDNQELTRAYQGTPVEQVLRDFSFKSNNENFGVNDDLEFFFQPRESVHIDRGIDNTQWFNYDIPELGKQKINEVEVWFDDGEESVIVDDGGDKLDLQDSLGLDDPGTQRAELNRPLLTDISDAEDEGRKYLQFRNATLSGTVTTFGLYEANPGDTIDITIDSRGIDTEFVIAGVEYRWGVDETILTIVEKRGDTDDILFDLTESVQRVEMNGANREAPKNRITTTQANAIIDVSVEANDIETFEIVSGETVTTASGTTDTYNTVKNAGTYENAGTVEATVSPTAEGITTRFVNDGRNAVRDGWAGKPNPAIQNIVVGDDNSGLSRSNESLRNQTNTATVTESLSGDTAVEYSATITQTGVQEIGLTTDNDTLLTRVVFDDPIELGGTVTFTLDVSNDNSVSRGVLTQDGQEAVRDVLADNSPNAPTDYGYGSDGTTVAESDTALGNRVVSQDLDKFLVEQLDSTTDFENATEFGNDKRIVIENDSIRVAQSGFFVEAEQADFQRGSSQTTNLDFSAQSGIVTDGINADALISEPFVPEYDIPAGDVVVAMRHEVAADNDNPPGELFIQGPDGTRLDTGTFTENGFLNSNPDWFIETLTSAPTLEKGEQYRFGVEVFQTGSTSSNMEIDCLHVGDARFSYTYDDTLGEFNELSGPELFPAVDSVSLAAVSTRRDATQAIVELDINETDNGQFIEISPDGNTFTRSNNTDSATDTFNATREIFVNLGLDGTTPAIRTSSPSERYEAQTVNVHNLFANPDAVTSEDIGETTTRAVISPNTITGETLRESGLFNGNTLLTRAVFAEFDVLDDQRVASAETTRFNGTN